MIEELYKEVETCVLRGSESTRHILAGIYFALLCTDQLDYWKECRRRYFVDHGDSSVFNDIEA
jgi:hypothetical protein